MVIGIQIATHNAISLLSHKIFTKMEHEMSDMNREISEIHKRKHLYYNVGNEHESIGCIGFLIHKKELINLDRVHNT